MSEVTREIVGAKLVLGVKAFRLEIFSPLFELLPVESCEVRVAFHLRDGAEQQQQIAALLDRHLVLLGAFAAAINLAVRLGISAEVMRRERELPTFACRIVHEGHKERLRRRWSEEQELRRHRIKHVRSANATVRVVLFAELERLAIVIGDELASRETLAVGERSQFCILLAACAREVGHEFLVERFATFLQRLIISRGGLEQIGGLPAVAAPVRPEVLLHVLDRVEIVVGEHQPAGDGFSADSGDVELDRRNCRIGCSRGNNLLADFQE